MSRIHIALMFGIAFIVLSAKAVAEPTPTVPKTFLEFWNEEGTVEENNCYNYATNRATNNFAQPGEASDQIYRHYTCSDVSAAAAADLGVEPIDYFPYTSANDATLIALVVYPGRDFHWYRRDSSHFWSHKMGGRPATTYDNDGERIRSPETANRGDYVDFCGYFKVKSFPVSDDQQNSGYVRIGAMRRLPRMPTDRFVFAQPEIESSKVEQMIYSGRTNPRLSLKDALKKDEFRGLLERISTEVASSINVGRKSETVKAAFEKTTLGRRGIAIHDTEGLVFPKGSKVTLIGSTGFAVYVDGQTYFGDADPELLEAILRTGLSL